MLWIDSPLCVFTRAECRAIDGFFKDVMKKTAEDPHCLTAGIAPGLMDQFKRNNEALEGIAKGLEEFLEVCALPRLLKRACYGLVSMSFRLKYYPHRSISTTCRLGTLSGRYRRLRMRHNTPT